MNDREQIYSCEECGKPIYSGDKVCVFYGDVIFCEEHAVTRSSEIAHLRWALSDDEWQSCYEDNPFQDRASFEAHVLRLEAELGASGDGPACVVTA